MKTTGWIILVIVAVAAGFFVGKMVMGAKLGVEAVSAAIMGGGAPPAVKVVETSLEKASPVTEYIAHVEPIQQVNIAAQVEGIIEKVHFREGSRVKEGDLLFTIDPKPYQATVAQRKAELAQATAALGRAEKYLAMLNAADNRSVSKSDLDTAEANVMEGQAQVQNAEAVLKNAQIDLDYTQVKSPIDGRIGRALITKGNLVSPSSGALATVIQVDPVRVVFAMPDAEYLTAFQQYSNDESYNPSVRVRLANGDVLSGFGTIDFDDNQMNPSTGTIDIRMRFENPNRMLVANNYVTALVSDGNAPMKVLVPVDAVMYGADGAFVWTVGDGNVAVQVPVKVGAVLGAQQIIESGLNAGQRVIYAGMQSIRAAGMPVTPIESAKSE